MVHNLWIISHKKKEEVQKLFKGFNLLKAQDPPPEVPEEKAEEKTESSTWVKIFMCSVQFWIRIKLLKPILITVSLLCKVCFLGFLGGQTRVSNVQYRNLTLLNIPVDNFISNVSKYEIPKYLIAFKLHFNEPCPKPISLLCNTGIFADFHQIQIPICAHLEHCNDLR